MKILSIPQIRQADAYTIEFEPIESINLMERAGQACYQWITDLLKAGRPIKVFAGMGNNGGDGLVIARLLAEDGHQTQVILINDSNKPSRDFSSNLARIRAQNKAAIVEINAASDIPDIEENDLVIDAIYGSGLNKPVVGLSLDCIHAINDSSAIVIAIDMPSGLFADKSTRGMKAEAVKADYTLCLQFPKLAMLMAENDLFIGEWHVIPIGLHPDFIRKVDVDHYFLQASDVQPLLRTRPKFSHKGNFGHALLIAGSKHKMGAAILAAKAALRSGVGLLTVHIPESGISAMHCAVPEAMVSSYPGDKFYHDMPDLTQFDAIAIGPGLGTNDGVANSLKQLIQNTPCPLILDADALNILAENPTWLAFLPKKCILTPHPGEFRRLTGNASDDFERLQKLVHFTQKNQFISILKGAHTAIGCTDGYCFFNSTGNPGMATAGSGDVLCGILLGLRAQNYDSEQCAILGTYLHGLAGDIASRQRGEEGMIAGDIIEVLPLAFNELRYC